jgi:hypothetical protein
VVLSEVALTGIATSLRIARDPLGELRYEGDERRRLCRKILADIDRRHLAEVDTVAFEVGILGYRLPGRVHDILGLVSPEVLEHGGAKNPLYLIHEYEPEYVVICDSPSYPPTGPIIRSEEFQSTYHPMVVQPRPFDQNYVVFKRSAPGAAGTGRRDRD